MSAPAFAAEWLRLSEAVAVLSKRMTVDEAKAWLLRAIEDRLSRDYSAQDLFSLEGYDAIPARFLKRADRSWANNPSVDWETSCIRAPHTASPFLRRITPYEPDLPIRVSSPALDRYLSPAASSSLLPIKRTRHLQPGRERAMRAIAAVFPSGIPDRVALPNSTLCRRVADWMKVNNLATVADRTVLRAAGRAK